MSESYRYLDSWVLIVKFKSGTVMGPSTALIHSQRFYSLSDAKEARDFIGMDSIIIHDKVPLTLDDSKSINEFWESRTNDKHERETDESL